MWIVYWQYTRYFVHTLHTICPCAPNRALCAVYTCPSTATPPQHRGLLAGTPAGRGLYSPSSNSPSPRANPPVASRAHEATSAVQVSLTLDASDACQPTCCKAASCSGCNVHMQAQQPIQINLCTSEFEFVAHASHIALVC
jgi:hypothetical protein